jgi:hypothetical protein
VKTYALPYGAYAGLPLAYGAAAPAYTYAAAPAYTYAAAAPAYTYAAAPSYAAAPAYAYAAAPYSTGSQFHAQDEFGNLNYGYTNINSAKQEVGNTYGGVSGAYSYVDADGKLQQVTYVADALGFRTADSRLPVAPVDTGVAPVFNPEPLVAPVDTGVAPEPVQDTAEVAEARAAHLAAVEAAKTVVERRRREAAVLSGASTVLTAPTPIIHNAPVLPATYALPTYGYGYAGLGYGYGGLGYAGLGYAGLTYLG